MEHTRRNRTGLLVNVLATLLLVWMAVVVTCSQWKMSPTFDEQNHVTRGISILRTGDYRLVLHHPPLANILEALPVAWQPNGFSTKMPAWQPTNLSIWEASSKTVWQHPTQGVRLIHLARIPVLLFALGLGLLIFVWSRELFGPWGGLFSLAFYVLDPSMLAHSGLATTDIPAACTLLLAVYLIRQWYYRPSKGRFALAGLGVGLALATKFTALLLAPILAVLLLVIAIRPTGPAGSLAALWAELPFRRRFARAVGAGLALLAVAGVALWGVYGFRIEQLGGKIEQPVSASASVIQRIPVPSKQYLRGIKTVKTQAEEHPAYLLGMTDTTGKGWWYYFPVVIATKTPLPALVLMLGALLLALLPRMRARMALPRRELLFLLVPAGIYLLAALGLLGVNLNLGIRHILPLYPFLYILIGEWLALRVRARAFRPALAVAVIAQCASVALAFPHFLAYFNEVSETRVDGYHILVDSNYDWGQDLARLAELQRKDRLEPLYLSYFGTTPPEAYGIHYRPLVGYGPSANAPKPDFAQIHGFVAISVTNLMEVDRVKGIDYRYLREQGMLFGQAGKTILVYWLPGSDNTTGGAPSAK